MLLVSKGLRQGILLIIRANVDSIIFLIEDDVMIRMPISNLYSCSVIRVSAVDIITHKVLYKNILILTLDRGSLGSWVDEDRSKLRVAM